ncbi:MAG TPA: haloacid dehalogenase-like hydrolase [Mycobacteriales bacterium]|nr:haloacid dehalogenase-like hydrolase [Mycobacteriales bacterium]
MTDRLLLWDIDSTLIRTGDVSRRAFAAAFHEVTGHAVAELAETSGRTDPAIFSDTLQLHGLRDPGDYFERFARRLGPAYRDRIDPMRRVGRVLPGARELLAACRIRPGVVQTVLTGNVRESAEIKLEAFSLTPFLRLDVGAYGDDDPHRPNLVPIARRRAAAVFDGPLDPVIIGDTVHDVSAGLAHGVPVIGVATGRNSAAELRAAGATAVFRDLSDHDAVLAAILPDVTGPG